MADKPVGYVPIEVEDPAGGGCMRPIPLIVLLLTCTLTCTVRVAIAAPRVAPGPVEVVVSSSATGEPVAQVQVRLGGRYCATAKDGRATVDRDDWRPSSQDRSVDVRGRRVRRVRSIE